MPTACAFNMSGATVNLTLYGNNMFSSGSSSAGLQAPIGSTLTINGSGSLIADGGMAAAGIGGGNNEAGGTITIQSGAVTANGRTGAGIGGGDNSTGGTITIQGGTVIARGNAGAGIGGGNNGASGVITITGGAVTAKGGDGFTASPDRGGSAGIGSGGTGAAVPNAVNTVTVTTELISGGTPADGQVLAIGGTSGGTGGAGANIGQGGYDGGSGTGIASLTHPIAATVTPPATANFGVTVTPALSPTIAYQWQVSTDNRHDVFQRTGRHRRHNCQLYDHRNDSRNERLSVPQ